MDKSVLANLAAQLQQVVTSLQSLGGEEGDYGMESMSMQPIPRWASIDARLPARPYQPLVSREKHVVDLAAEMAANQGGPPTPMGADEYGMPPPEEDEGAAMMAMGVM